MSDDEIDACWESIPDCAHIANYEDQRKFAREILRLAAITAAPPAEDLVTFKVAVDAKRYQWLRMNWHYGPQDGAVRSTSDGGELDAAIDDALAGTKEGEK
jgi:hypothetical protein